MRTLLTMWWFICAIFNLYISQLDGFKPYRIFNFILCLFSIVMFARSISKLLAVGSHDTEHNNSGDGVCDRLVERERTRPIKTPIKSK